MAKLIPNGELTFHTWENCQIAMDILLDEGYVLLLSREEELYVINYLWTKENCADRNDVVFMDRDEFEYRYYEDPDIREDEAYDFEDRVRDETRKATEQKVWWYAKTLLDSSPSTIESIFCLDQMGEEAKDRFWSLFPNQLTFEEVKNRIDNYNELRDAALGERIMEEALANWDKTNKDRYEDELARQAKEIQSESNS